MRYDSPHHYLPRVVDQDFDLHGTTLRAGQTADHRHGRGQPGRDEVRRPRPARRHPAQQARAPVAARSEHTTASAPRWPASRATSSSRRSCAGSPTRGCSTTSPPTPAARCCGRSSRCPPTSARAGLIHDPTSSPTSPRRPPGTGAGPAFVHRGRAVTFAELDDAADRFASAARAAGLQPGDRVLLLLAERDRDLRGADRLRPGRAGRRAGELAAGARTSWRPWPADAGARLVVVDPSLAHLCGPSSTAGCRRS